MYCSSRSIAVRAPSREAVINTARTWRRRSVPAELHATSSPRGYFLTCARLQQECEECAVNLRHRPPHRDPRATGLRGHRSPPSLAPCSVGAAYMRSKSCNWSSQRRGQVWSIARCISISDAFSANRGSDAAVSIMSLHPVG